jgi:pimeloyl-ACP methyl ester carboxylesterase
MFPPDDDLIRFEESGAIPLPRPDAEGRVEHDGARLWYASYGSGPAVVLLHGGLGHSGNWGAQVPALTAAGYRAVLIDSRGHGRSTRDEQPYRYELMAGDVLAVMNRLVLDKATLVGWSDGATIALILALLEPARVTGVLFFGGNMDTGGVKPLIRSNPLIDRCIGRHAADYALLSSTPDNFRNFVAGVNLMMNTQPNYTADDLRRVSVPVTIVHSANDEFIRREHADYLAYTIPLAEMVVLPDVSHFAPIQRPQLFNETILAFVRKLGAGGG